MRSEATLREVRLVQQPLSALNSQNSNLLPNQKSLASLIRTEESEVPEGGSRPDDD
jgi:hypothetical protein